MSPLTWDLNRSRVCRCEGQEPPTSRRREYRPGKHVLYGLHNRDATGGGKPKAAPRDNWSTTKTKRKPRPRKRTNIEDSDLPGSHRPIQGGRGAQPLGGVECWKCGRLPAQPNYQKLIKYGANLGIVLDHEQARQWAARYSSIPTACHGLDRLALAWARRRANRPTPVPLPDPVLTEAEIKRATARAVDGPELVRWLDRAGLLPLAKKTHGSQVSRWRRGMVADIYTVDALLTTLGTSLSALPVEILLDRLPRPKSGAAQMECAA